MRQSKQLMTIVYKFFIRRTAQDVLKKLIPPKTDLVIFVRPCPLQRRLYECCTKVGVGMALDEGSTLALKLVDTLRKVCNHPRLLFADLNKAADVTEEKVTTMLKTTKAMEEDMLEAEEGENGGGKGSKKQKKKQGKSEEDKENADVVLYDVAMSTKLQVLEDLLAAIYEQTNDRVVLVSNFTTTLSVLEQMIKGRRWKFLR